MESPLFSEFVTTFCLGFIALQAHEHAFTTLVEITAVGSSFPCFKNCDVRSVVAWLKARFASHLTKEETVAHCLNVIRSSVNSYGTSNYDCFQYLSNGMHNNILKTALS